MTSRLQCHRASGPDRFAFGLTNFHGAGAIVSDHKVRCLASGDALDHITQFVKISVAGFGCDG